MAQHPNYRLIAALICTALAAACLAFAVYPPIFRHAVDFGNLSSVAPLAVMTIAFSIMFVVLFGATRAALLRTIASVYRVLFSSVPGAARLHYKQDGLLLIQSNGQCRFVM